MILQSVSDQQAQSLAAHFFKYDYRDRGMLKWQGFFLSDHQAALHRRHMHHGIPLFPQESLATVSAKLLEGWQSQQTVVIQMQSIDLNQRPVSYSGIIKGVVGPHVLLDQDQRAFTRLKITEIRAVILKTFDLDH